MDAGRMTLRNSCLTQVLVS